MYLEETAATMTPNIIDQKRKVDLRKGEPTTWMRMPKKTTESARPQYSGAP